MAESDLTVQKALETAQSMDMAMANRDDFRDVSSLSDESGNKVSNFNSSKQPPEDRGVCFRCSRGHQLSGSRFNDAVLQMPEKGACGQDVQFSET